MAINQLQLPNAIPSAQVDWSPLAELGNVYLKGQQTRARQGALSQLGQPGGGTDLASLAMNLARSGDVAGANQIATLGKNLAGPETTDAIKNYQFAVKNGFKGTPLEYETAKAAAGATKVNTNNNINTGEREYDKALNKDQADVFLGYQKAGRNASNAQNTLDLMENITKDPRFYSGTGGELVTRAKQAGASVGLVDKDAASPNEIFKSLGNKLVIDAAGGSLGAQISNADVGFIRDTVPNIANTPEGNRQMIGVQRKLYQRQQEVAKMARDYANKNGGRLDYKFDEQLADYASKNPLFPAQAARSQTQQPASQQQPKQAPDGNFYVPDPNRPGKYLKVVQ